MVKASNACRGIRQPSRGSRAFQASRFGLTININCMFMCAHVLRSCRNIPGAGRGGLISSGLQILSAVEEQRPPRPRGSGQAICSWDSLEGTGVGV